jgi:hypothetical protein
MLAAQIKDGGDDSWDKIRSDRLYTQPRLCVEPDSSTASARADVLRRVSLDRASTKTDMGGDEKRYGPECNRRDLLSTPPLPGPTTRLAVHFSLMK